MKVCFFPIGNKDRASSRYRVHWIHPEIDGFYVASGENWKKANALVFQRVYNPDLAKAARKMGMLIIFDCTDFYFYWHKLGDKKRTRKLIGQMAKAAHFLTTSNEDDAKDMRRTFGKRVYVIPGAQKKSNKIKTHKQVNVPTICWLGRESRMDETLGSVWPILIRLAFETRFKLLIINDSGSTHGLALPFGSEVIGRKWSLRHIYSMVAQCDIGICPQEKLPDGKYHKDRNTMVTFWMCGLPCVASGMTKDWYIDLRKLLLDWRERKRQGQKALTKARDYTPRPVAKKWYKIIEHERKKIA